MNKKIKQGFETASKMYEEKLKMQEREIKSVKEDMIGIQNEAFLDLVDVGEEHDNKINNILFSSKTTFDIKKLEPYEKEVFAGWLATVFFQTISTDPNDNQKRYFKNILNALEVISPQNLSINKIYNIKDIYKQEALLMMCLQWIFLENHNFNTLDFYQEALDYLSFSKATLQEYKDRITNLYNIAGIEAIVDSYLRNAIEQNNEAEEYYENENVEEDLIEDLEELDICEKINNILIKYSDIGRPIEKEKAPVLVAPKTIVQVYKGISGTLAFTTVAMYWFTKGTLYNVPYCKLLEDNISVALNESVVEGHYDFYYIAENKEDNILISDKSISGVSIQKALSEIMLIDSYPEEDHLCSLEDMTLEVKLGYIQLLIKAMVEIGQPLHEIFRIACNYNLQGYWHTFSFSRSSEQIQDELNYWQSLIPYPNEESLNIALATDYCKALQYTKSNESMTLKERETLNTLLTFNNDLTEEDTNNIIRIAHLEKRILEKNIDQKETDKILKNASSSLKILSSNYSVTKGVMATIARNWMFSVIPGIGVALVAANIIKSVISIKDNKKDSNKTPIMRLYYEQALSYLQSIYGTKKQYIPEIKEQLIESYMSLVYVSGALCPMAILSNNDYDIIHNSIIEFIKKNKVGSYFFCDLPYLSQKETVAQIADIEDQANYDNFLGGYDGIRKSVITSKHMGILFERKGFYYRKSSSTSSLYMPYADIMEVESDSSQFKIKGRSNYCITIDRFLYNSPDLLSLFKYLETFLCS